MMDAPDPPETPNPYATGAAQTSSNVNTAIANSVMGNANVYGPTGSSVFNQIGSQKIKEARKNKDGTVMTEQAWVPASQTEADQYRIWVGNDAGSTGPKAQDPNSKIETDAGGRYIDSRTGSDWTQGGSWETRTLYDEYDIPQWEQRINLTEDQQKLLDLQEQMGQSLGQFGLDQVDRLSDVLGKPFSLDGLPAGASALLGPDGLVDGLNLRQQFAPGQDFMPGFLKDMPTLGNVTSVGGVPQLQKQFADAGRVQRELNPLSRGLEYVGSLQRGEETFGQTARGIQYEPSLGMAQGAYDPARAVEYAGQGQRANTGFDQTSLGIQGAPNLAMTAGGYADSGAVQRNVGDIGFNMERDSYERAIMERMTPDLDRQRAGLENQLVNQGFTRGTEAFNAQMDEQIRRENDARIAATLASGQEQSRMAGLALSRFGAENSAQAQAEEQARARGLFGMSANQQNNTSLLAQQGAANSAQQQQYAQALGRGAFANDAMAQNNQMSLAETAARNAAQAQEQVQLRDRTQFSNDATAQNNSALLAAQQARNQAQQLDFTQQQARGAFRNDTRALNQQLALNEVGSRNATNMQEFEQSLGRGTFSNQAQGQTYDQALGRGTFANQALSTEFGMDVARTQANNQAQQQQFAQLMDMANFQREGALQQYNADMAQLQTQQGLRNSALQEQLLQRNQPINEISSLMSGAQVNMPQFAGFNPGVVNPTPVGDYVYKTADLDQRNYQSQLQAANQANAGLFSLGGQMVGGLFGMISDRRLKTDVEFIGINDNGLNVYAYRYVMGGPMQVGYMADEVLAVRPDAVGRMGEFLTVNYERLAA